MSVADKTFRIDFHVTEESGSFFFGDLKLIKGGGYSQKLTLNTAHLWHTGDDAIDSDKRSFDEKLIDFVWSTVMNKFKGEGTVSDLAFYEQDWKPVMAEQKFPMKLGNN